MRSSATRTSARPSIAARSTPKASRASRAFEGWRGRSAALAVAAAQDGGFETFTWGPDGFQRGGGRRGLSCWWRRRYRRYSEGDVRRRAARAARGRRLAVRAGGFRRPPAGRDVTGTVTITLPEVPTGTSRRVHLPTGKEIDAKIPAGLADGQTIRLKGQGLPGPGGAPATR